MKLTYQVGAIIFVLIINSGMIFLQFSYNPYPELGHYQ